MKVRLKSEVEFQSPQIFILPLLTTIVSSQIKEKDFFRYGSTGLEYHHNNALKILETHFMEEKTVNNEEVIARVMKRAKDNYKIGLNCAESVFGAVLAEQDWGLSPEALCVATGFGGGGGLFGGTCGSLNGAVAAVGLAYGRRTPPEGTMKEKIDQLYGKPGLYRVFNRLAVEFQTRFGSTLCRDITKDWQDDWYAKDRHRRCIETITGMAGLAAEMVFPIDLERWGSQPFGSIVRRDLKE